MVNDSVADLLTRVRNAQRAGHKSVVVQSSRLGMSVLEVLKKEGFIEGFEKKKALIGNFDGIEVVLKYFRTGQPAMSTIRRVSKPGRRTYTRATEIKKVHNGLGITIISTSEGVISDRDARRKKIGGEVLAVVS